MPRGQAQVGWMPGEAEAIVRAVEPQLLSASVKIWAAHPNNPANMTNEKLIAERDRLTRQGYTSASGRFGTIERELRIREKSPKVKVRIVTSDPEGEMGFAVRDFESFGAAEAAGFVKNGDRAGGPHLREELRGQPCLVGLCGPMWGGVEDGQSVVRYESQSACDRLSR